MVNTSKWTIVKIGGDNPHYRLFVSWPGGYLDGDSWIMNSGIIKVEEDGEWYLFCGVSGSVYRCHKNGYGVASSYNNSVLLAYKHRLGDKFEILQDKPDVMNTDWLI